MRKLGNMRVDALAVYPFCLTTAAEEWARLPWWQRLLCRLRLRKRPVGQIESVVSAYLETGEWPPLCRQSVDSLWFAYKPKGAASFADSLLDWSGNGNDLTWSDESEKPEWDTANGWKFDGESTYLRGHEMGEA